VKNYNVAVKEWDDEVIFLHKIIPGSADDSYGIYVAKLAGIPPAVIARAQKILTRLELKQDLKESLSGASGGAATEQQIDFFLHPRDPLAEEIKIEIKNINLDNITPIEAMTFLNDLKKIIIKENRE
jgi:DNA mismatch repair protein MutS